MTTGSATTMSQKQFESLRKVIYDQSGIHFPDGKKYALESRLTARLIELEMDSFDQYISFLTMGPYQNEEFQEMFDRITINETSFFRNEPQLEVFEKHILPELINSRSKTKRLRFWSAAASSGEEAYTLAILLHRTLGVRIMDWQIEILGTDISERVLELASAGRFTEYAMRSTPQTVRSRYFRQDGQYWHVNDTIKQMARFEVHNLKDRYGARRFGTWDVIFCRNVMIYFDDAMKTQLLKTFSDQLETDGALFIGHSESLRSDAKLFTPHPHPQGFCYQKAAGTPATAAPFNTITKKV